MRVFVRKGASCNRRTADRAFVVHDAPHTPPKNKHAHSAHEIEKAKPFVFLAGGASQNPTRAASRNTVTRPAPKKQYKQTAHERGARKGRRAKEAPSSKQQSGVLARAQQRASTTTHNNTTATTAIAHLERAADVVDAVDGGDVRQEGVAEALALRGAAHEAGDVADLQVRADLALGLVALAQPAEAVVRHVDARLLVFFLAVCVGLLSAAAKGERAD